MPQLLSASFFQMQKVFVRLFLVMKIQGFPADLTNISAGKTTAAAELTTKSQMCMIYNQQGIWEFNFSFRLF